MTSERPKSSVLRLLINWFRFGRKREAAPSPSDHKNPHPLAKVPPQPTPLPPHTAQGKPPMGSRTLALFETSLRFSTLIGHSPLAVVEWDPEYRITKWMGSAENLFGWRASEVVGRRLYEFGFIHIDDLETVRYALNELKSGRSSVVRNRNHCKNGRVVYCEWYNSALMEPCGQLAWGLSLALNVTARHQMEQALRPGQVRVHQSARIGRTISVEIKQSRTYLRKSTRQDASKLHSFCRSCRKVYYGVGLDTARAGPEHRDHRPERVRATDRQLHPHRICAGGRPDRVVEQTVLERLTDCRASLRLEHEVQLSRIETRTG
jgi:PAS domain S-box-containing protein